MPETLTAEQQATADAALAAEKVTADAKAAAVVPDAAKVATDAKLAADTATAEAKAAADAEAKKTADDAARAALVYTLKLPDGSIADPALVERTAAIARAQGLSNEAGQALLDATVSELQAQDTLRAEQWTPRTGAKWVEYANTMKAASLADPEIGGSPQKLANSVELGQIAIRTLADGDPKMEERFKTFLHDSGLDNNPDAIRLLSRIGKRMAEPIPILGATAATPGKKSMKESMYPGDGTGPKPTTTE